MKEHLGLLDGDLYGKWTGNVEDPLKKNFIQNVADTAHANGLIFNRFFGGSIIQKEDVKNYERLKEWMASPGLPTDQASEEQKHVYGRLIPYPRNFPKVVVLNPQY